MRLRMTANPCLQFFLPFWCHFFSAQVLSLNLDKGNDTLMETRASEWLPPKHRFVHRMEFVQKNQLFCAFLKVEHECMEFVQLNLFFVPACSPTQVWWCNWNQATANHFWDTSINFMLDTILLIQPEIKSYLRLLPLISCRNANSCWRLLVWWCNLKPNHIWDAFINLTTLQCQLMLGPRHY